MKQNQFDVIIAGGGVIGCAAATYLLRYDPAVRVAIIEKDPTYKYASTPLSDGNTRLQFNVKENIQISQYGVEVLANFAEEMAVGDSKPDPAFRQEGNLFLVDEHGVADAKRGLAQQQALGCEVYWLEQAELPGRFPLLEPSAFVGGTFGPLDGTMDPWAVLLAYKNKAVALGAHYLQGEVTAVTHEKGKVTGVTLANGDNLQTPYVINAAGAWAAALAKTAGVHLPIDPVMRQVFVLETAVQPETILPALFFPSGLYLIHERAGHFMVGKSFPDDPIGFDFRWNRHLFEERIWPELVDHIPAFDRLKVTRGWAGLYAVNTFDGNVILGEWPELRGFLLANGYSGHGFQQCHAVGRYLAELVLGLPHALDLSVFSPERLFTNRRVLEGASKIV